MGTAAMPAAMVSDIIEAGQLRQINYSWVPDSLVFRARYDALRSPAFVGAAAGLARDCVVEFESG